MARMDLLSIVGVLVILLAVIVYNNIVAARGRKAKAKDDPASAATVHPLLCKFARHDGSVVGETVAFDGDRLILKQAGQFKAVPTAQATEKDGEVILTGDIDWTAAAAAGTAWHASRRRADDGVAGSLTRSEDVKSPALDAFRKREGQA